MFNLPFSRFDYLSKEWDSKYTEKHGHKIAIILLIKFISKIKDTEKFLVSITIKEKKWDYLSKSGMEIKEGSGDMKFKENKFS